MTVKAYYNCDESSGDLLDATGNGYTQVASGSPGTTSGALNTCRSFTSSDSTYVSSISGVAGNSPFSISGWFKIDGHSTLTYWWQFSGNDWSLVYDQANDWLAIWDGSSSAMATGVTIPVNTWTFVAVTSNGSSTVNLRINSTDYPGTFSSTSSNSSDFGIAGSGSDNRFFDELRIDDVELNSTALDALYNGGTPPGYSAGSNTTVTPDTATLTLSTYAPTVTVSNNKVVTPGTASLTLTRFAPTVSTPVLCTPGRGGLFLTTYAPSVLTPVLCTPATATLTLSMYAPDVAATIATTTAPSLRLVHPWYLGTLANGATDSWTSEANSPLTTWTQGMNAGKSYRGPNAH